MKLLSILFVVSAVFSPLSKGATINLDLEKDLIPNGDPVGWVSQENGEIKFIHKYAPNDSPYGFHLNAEKAAEFAKATSVKFSFEFSQDMAFAGTQGSMDSFMMNSLLSSKSFNAGATYTYAAQKAFSEITAFTDGMGSVNGDGLGMLTNSIDIEYVILSENSFKTIVRNLNSNKESSFTTNLDGPIGDLLLNLSFGFEVHNQGDHEAIAKLKGISYTTSPSVPEPSTASLGLIALGLAICRRSRKK